MTDDWDDVTLTPWERATVARMEEELDLRDPCPLRGRRPADPPRLALFAGSAIAAFGAGTALVAGLPLSLAGWILLLVGVLMVWEQF